MGCDVYDKGRNGDYSRHYTFHGTFHTLGLACRILLLSPGKREVGGTRWEQAVPSLIGLLILIAATGRVSTGKSGKGLLRQADLLRQEYRVFILGRPDLCSDLHLQLRRALSYVPLTHRSVHALPGE